MSGKKIHGRFYADLQRWIFLISNIPLSVFLTMSTQGGRTWQPFVGGKNGHENIRQTHIYNFRDKCVVFARNRKFANLTQ